MKSIDEGTCVKIEAVEIEFREGGNTIWVHGPQGATILRIKTNGRINVHAGCENICSHADIMVAGNIDVCVTKDDFTASEAVH